MQAPQGYASIVRKVIPRGPVTRLAAPPMPGVGLSALPGAVLGRDDWNAGRDLTSEEHHCGLVLRLRDIPAEKRTTAATRSVPPVLDGVVKAQTSDFQVNEVDTNGASAFLEHTPKGRWRKVSRQKTQLVENSSTPFSDATKTYNPLVMSYGEYVRRIGKLPKDSPLLQFVLYRDGQTMESVLNRFRYELGIDPDAIHFRGGSSPPSSSQISVAAPSPSTATSFSIARAPPGGSFGCVSQFGCCVGVTREQIAHVSRHYNLHPLLVDPRGYYPVDKFSALSAPPLGYFYRILLRCVNADDESQIQATLGQLSANGFINYFGLENFGVSHGTLFEAAAMAAQGDYHAAAGCYFQSLAESNPLHYEHYLSYVNAEPSTAAALASSWATGCREAKCTRPVQRSVSALAAYHAQGREDGGKTLWDSIGLEGDARRSAAEFVWNAMATQRLLTGGAGRVLVGDVVVDRNREHLAEGWQTHRLVATQEEASQYDITDVVLPVAVDRPSPYQGSPTLLYPNYGQVDFLGLHDEFVKRHKLGFLLSSGASFSCQSQEFRPLVVKPRGLQAAVVHDPSSLAALKNDVFLRQERQTIGSLDLDYESRVREPSPYNVSERFAERMNLVRRQHRGTHSLALSFLLPSGASPLVALRECFALKYPNFTDLYFTS